MIVVIADDFTGAAELGGIGLRYNLKVEVNTEVNLLSSADLLIIATDTRSMTKEEAIRETERVTDAVIQLKPALLFKKVDSVLRGYIAEELSVIIQKLNTPKALLVPANPHLGRTIVAGNYLINSAPLHTSSFANDPEFPISTSSVVDLLSNKGIAVTHQKHTDALNNEGIIIGDTTNADDLNAWAEMVSANMVAAGAAGFFTALLDKIIPVDKFSKQLMQRAFIGPMLIISGTAFKNSQNALRKLKNSGQPVSYMPVAIVLSDAFDERNYRKWCLEIEGYILTFGKAIIAIDPLDTKGMTNQAKALREKTARVVKMVFDQTHINELLIEGGSTASAIFKHLGISKLYPVDELAPGVVRMNTDDLSESYITIKPGSYAWPESLQALTLY